MSTEFRRGILAKRFTAHHNLIKIARYHGADERYLQQYMFADVEQFASAWKETISESGKEAILGRDAEHWEIPRINNDGLIVIIFISNNKPGSNITKKTIDNRLKRFLVLYNQHNQILNEDQIEDGIGTLNGLRGYAINLGIQMILYSNANLDSGANREILYYNSLIRFPIKHFTVGELQYDPVEHATAPKIMRALESDEVEDIISRQIGLPGEYRMDGLGEDYLEELKRAEGNEHLTKKIITKLRNLALSKLPSINHTDPIVKRRGFRVGDIIYIERKYGPTPVTYRLVIRLDPEMQTTADLSVEDE